MTALRASLSPANADVAPSTIIAATKNFFIFLNEFKSCCYLFFTRLFFYSKSTLPESVSSAKTAEEAAEAEAHLADEASEAEDTDSGNVDFE
jgi:hypothetical protein